MAGAHRDLHVLTHPFPTRRSSDLRRGFLQAWEAERNRADRKGTTLGLLLLDVDRLKAINDRYGHQAGDRVLVHIVRRLATALRSEEHTSELQSLMRISYAVFCLKKKNQHTK